MVDWKKILKAYIKHVGREEGIDYIINGFGDYRGPDETFGLSAEEQKALFDASQEVNREETITFGLDGK